MVVLGLSLLLVSSISYLIYRSSSSRIPTWRWLPQFFQKRLNGHPPPPVEVLDIPKGPEVNIIGDDDFQDQEESDGETTPVAGNKSEKRKDWEWPRKRERQDTDRETNQLAKGLDGGSFPSSLTASRPGISIQEPTGTDENLHGPNLPSLKQQEQQKPLSTSSSSQSTLMPPPPPRLPKQSLNPSFSSSSSPSPASLLRTPHSSSSSSSRNARLSLPTTTSSSSLLPPPTTSTLAPTSPRNPTTTNNNNKRPRKPVILAPGHSPLDWARLERSGVDLRGPSFSSSSSSSGNLLRVSSSQLQKHNKRSDAWTVLNGRVYNVTPYLPFHPGGEPELMRAAGRDGTRLMMEIHPWVNFEGMLRACLVGVFVAGNNEEDYDDGKKRDGKKRMISEVAASTGRGDGGSDDDDGDSSSGFDRGDKLKWEEMD
ncbi:MAG: hypothetical protein M1823_000170 [Watsoniomyces obsoletus]|nr:MAG: hypothetical protein M1823_000170 [Watsoniomyces obsoletus]